MASITIPTPIQTTCTTIVTHIINGDTASIQSLLGDTDFTCSDHCLKYKNLPIFTNIYSGGEQQKYLLYATDRGHGANGTSSSLTNYFGDGSDPVYFYMFNTFIVILSMVTIDTINSSTRNVCLIDKTNVEAFDAFTNYGRGSSLSGILGIMFNYLDNSTPVYDKYYPNDVGTPSHSYRNCNIRRASVSECTYAPLCGYTGTQASRVVMFTDFPNGSSNGVLHVGDKYYYILPIDETVITFTRYDYDGIAAYTEQQEAYCALGIDVTSEVS